MLLGKATTSCSNVMALAKSKLSRSFPGRGATREVAILVGNLHINYI